MLQLLHCDLKEQIFETDELDCNSSVKKKYLNKSRLDGATAACSPCLQRYTYRVLKTIQMKLILLCVSAEPAVLGSTKTALKFKYEI